MQDFSIDDGGMMRRLWRASAVMAAMVAQFAIGPSWASQQSLTLFGHKVEILGPVNEEKLVVDGKQMLSDAILLLDRVEVVGGVGIAIGGSGNGGNACDAAPFIVSFPKGEPARLDGPLPECGTGEVSIHDDTVVIDEPGVVGEDGHRYRWTAKDGFAPPEKLASKPDPKLGWAALRRRDLHSTVEFYNYAEIVPAIKALAGVQEPDLLLTFTGPSGGEFKGDRYVGTSCQAHNCNVAGSLVIAEIDTKSIYLAWRLEGQKIVVRPPVKEWPTDDRFELKTWAKQWGP